MTGKSAKSRTRQNRTLIVARLRHGWTTSGLARQAGISTNTVLNAERGAYVEPPTQKALSDALGVDQFELFPMDRQREFA